MGARQSRAPPVPGLRPASVCLHVSVPARPVIRAPSVRPSSIRPSDFPEPPLGPGHVRALHRGAQRQPVAPWPGDRAGPVTELARQSTAAQRPAPALGRWPEWDSGGRCSRGGLRSVGRHQPLTPVTQCPLHKTGTCLSRHRRAGTCSRARPKRQRWLVATEAVRVRACVRACVRGPGRAAWFRLPLWAQGLVVAPVLC